MTDEERFFYNHGYKQAERDFIKELEKIKTEIQEQIDFFKKIESFANAYGLEIANGIIKCRIAELKGE